ncbi:MAG: hypothetical protein R2747_00120 [Pyrinomonadaceae bacterium]
MNDNRCPKCDLLNLPSALICLKCKTPLTPGSASGFGHRQTATEIKEARTEEFPNPQTAPLSPAVETRRFHPNTGLYTQPDYSGSSVSASLAESKTGPRTYFWYRMLNSAVVVFGIFLAVIGLLAIIGSFNETGQQAADAFAGGIFFLVTGGIPGFLCFFGVVFPPRAWSWYYGLFILILATLSCGLAIFSVPLLIFWVKPETQFFFGRN